MSRKQSRTCPYCRTVYRSACCPLCREERLHAQSTYQPDWDDIESEKLMEEIDRENGERPYFDYDYGLEE
jgi:hypothetical protein